MPTVLVVPVALMENPAGPHATVLREAGFDVRYPSTLRFVGGQCNEEETIAELRGADAVIAGGAETYSRRVLEESNLRVVARSGVGYDRVDVAAATARRIAVTITPTANHEAVAELALALMFALAKRIVSGDQAVHRGQWPRVLPAPIRGRTIGLVGLGRIGRSMAVRCRALGMHVLAVETQPDRAFVEREQVELVGLPELLARSDYVSAHCPLTPETRGLFDRQAFARIKPGAFFINTARGPLVDEAALVEALESGRVRGAGLDVFVDEPPDPQAPLLRHPGVVASPHIAGADEESAIAMGVEAAQCIARLSRNEWPDGAGVNEQLRDGWSW